MLEQQFWVKAVHDISRYESKDQTFQATGSVHTWSSSPDISIILIHTNEWSTLHVIQTLKITQTKVDHHGISVTHLVNFYPW